MKLADYLQARQETTAAFSRRADIPSQTIDSILAGGGCRVSTAWRIIEASKAEPAPDGARVTLKELIPEGTEPEKEALR